MLRRLTRFGTLNGPENDRSDVLPCFLEWERSLPATSSPAALSLPNPQPDEHPTVVGELIPNGFIGLAVGDLAEGGTIDPEHDSPVDDDVIENSVNVLSRQLIDMS
jgi:hypothetical protein